MRRPVQAPAPRADTVEAAHATLLGMIRDMSRTGDIDEQEYGHLCAYASGRHGVDHDAMVDAFESGPGRDLTVVSEARARNLTR